MTKKYPCKNIEEWCKQNYINGYDKTGHVKLTDKLIKEYSLACLCKTCIKRRM